jgi:hypothetical protein
MRGGALGLWHLYMPWLLLSEDPDALGSLRHSVINSYIPSSGAGDKWSATVLVFPCSEKLQPVTGSVEVATVSFFRSYHCLKARLPPRSSAC